MTAQMNGDPTPRQISEKVDIAVPSTALLRAVLPFGTSGDGFWQCRDEAWLKCVPQIESQMTQSSLPSDVLMLKEHPDKRVLLWQNEAQAVLPTIVKVTTALKRRCRFRTRRRLESEAFALVCAERRGLRVPKLHACGTWGWWFCRRRVVLCMEYLPWPSLLEQLSSANNEAERWRLMRRVSKLLHQLQDSGCVHVDFGPHNILMAPDLKAGDVLIDWEFAGFPVRASNDAFAAQAGYFSWMVATSGRFVSPNLIEAWFSETLSERRFTNPDRMWTIWRRNYLTRESSRLRMSWH